MNSFTRNRTKCDIQRAAQILGKTTAAVYMDIARKRIPFRKHGKRVFFFEEELLEFLNNQPGITLEDLLSTRS